MNVFMIFSLKRNKEHVHFKNPGNNKEKKNLNNHCLGNLNIFYFFLIKKVQVEANQEDKNRPNLDKTWNKPK